MLVGPLPLHRANRVREGRIHFLGHRLRNRNRAVDTHRSPDIITTITSLKDNRSLRHLWPLIHDHQTHVLIHHPLGFTGKPTLLLQLQLQLLSGKRRKPLKHPILRHLSRLPYRHQPKSGFLMLTIQLSRHLLISQLRHSRSCRWRDSRAMQPCLASTFRGRASPEATAGSADSGIWVHFWHMLGEP
jgi:hypothetical protein